MATSQVGCWFPELGWGQGRQVLTKAVTVFACDQSHSAESILGLSFPWGVSPLKGLRNTRQVGPCLAPLDFGLLHAEPQIA